MRKFKVFATTNYVGCKAEDEFEVEDDATEQEIEDTARVMIAEMLDTGWYEVDENGDQL